MKSKEFEIESLLDLPDEELLERLFNPCTPTLEWVAVSAVIDQRHRAKDAADEIASYRVSSGRECSRSI